MSLLLPLLEVGFLAGLVLSGGGWPPVLGAFGALAAAGASSLVAIWLRRPILSGLLFPIGTLLNAY